MRGIRINTTQNIYIRLTFSLWRTSRTSVHLCIQLHAVGEQIGPELMKIDLEHVLRSAYNEESSKKRDMLWVLTQNVTMAPWLGKVFLPYW